MANRHLSRSIVLQTLFEWDFNGAKNDSIEEILKRNESEFGPGLDDHAYIAALLDLVLKKRQIIDDIIEKAAPDWPLEKIAIPDRNILRMGLAELLFGDRTEVPPKVAINEAIELAKTFGGENSSRFVNGVLGAVYKEIGEPGKEEFSKNKKQTEPVDPLTLPLERLGGAVIFSSKDKDIYLAFVHDIFGYWTLSKGGIEENEDAQQGTIREIKSELGIDIEIVSTLGENEYIASKPDGKVRKHVYYFLGQTKFQELKLTSSGGLDGADWFKIDEIDNLKIYNDILPIITKGVEQIINLASM